MNETPKITNVYAFTNGMLMAFDQYGQQMADYQGKADEMIPKVRAAGYTGEIPYGNYRPDTRS